MNKSVLSAQLYTVRDFIKTPADIAVTMKKIRNLGYESVQVSGMGEIEPKELKKIVDGEGITISATHIPFTRLLNDLEKVIEEHILWNCKYIGIGSMPGEYKNADGYCKFVKIASEIAKKLSSNRLTFFYHNHSFEFNKIDNQTIMEILFNESIPELKFCIDTYWVQHGGGDPAGWIRKFKNRVPLVHLKDMVIDKGVQIMAEVGEGNLNWMSILDACKESGVEWYIVEQDTCQRDPFESLSISLNNLHKLGIK